MSGFDGAMPTPINSNSAQGIRDILDVPSNSEMEAAIAQSTANTTRIDCNEDIGTFADKVTAGGLQYFRMRYGQPSSTWNYSTGFVFAPSSSDRIVVMFSREADGIVMKAKWNGAWTAWMHVGLAAL